MYLEYHSVCPLVGIGTPTPLPQACPTPLDPKGEGTHSPVGEGVGESQSGRLEKNPSTLSIYGRYIRNFQLENYL